jgi:8-oxo-dGTP pyrophosphatase MutT (NUDIX family)
MIKTFSDNHNAKPPKMPSHPVAAVAIIRVSMPEDSFLLLRRNSNPRDPWSGHFSFPGGRWEEQDSDLLVTCTRETYEETGITLTSEAVQGKLPARYAGSRVNSLILVQPFVFKLNERPPLTLAAAEIQSYCWLTAESFQQKKLHVEAQVLPDRYAPAFPIDDYYLWGFTYGLLKNVLEIE